MHIYDTYYIYAKRPIVKVSVVTISTNQLIMLPYVFDRSDSCPHQRLSTAVTGEGGPSDWEYERFEGGRVVLSNPPCNVLDMVMPKVAWLEL